jgi:hypothetical protein
MLANDDLQGTETIIPRLAKVSPKRRKQFKRNRRHTVCAVVLQTYAHTLGQLINDH